MSSPLIVVGERLLPPSSEEADGRKTPSVMPKDVEDG